MAGLLCVVYLTLTRCCMAGRAIDKLRKAANLKSTRRLVVLDNGDEFILVNAADHGAAGEANRDAKSDINQFVLQLL